MTDKQKTTLQAAWNQRKVLRAEGSKLYAEGDKLHAEGDLVFINAVLAQLSNVALQWTINSCVVNGVTFE